MKMVEIGKARQSKCGEDLIHLVISSQEWRVVSVSCPVAMFIGREPWPSGNTLAW